MPMTTERALAIALSVLEAFGGNAAYADYQAADRDALGWTDDDYADMLAALRRLVAAVPTS